MSMAIQQEIAELFRESEACGSCLICATGNLRRALDRLVAKGAALRPIPGGYVRPDHWNSLNPREQALHEIRALSRLHPAWTFCRTSAAIVHGLWVSNNLTHPHCIVASKSSHGCHRAGVIRCATEVADADIVTAGGIRVTTLLRTTMDCLRHLEFEAALPIADSSLRLSGATSEELTEHLRSSCAGHPGLIQALFTASHANGLSESGGESLARAIMIREGFMLPRLQVEIPDPFDRARTYRADFLWELPDHSCVIGEFDGREKYQNPRMTKGRNIVDVLAEERLRESRLSATGARVMRFSYADICNVPFFVRLLEQYGIPRTSRPRRRRATCRRHLPAPA